MSNQNQNSVEPLTDEEIIVLREYAESKIWWRGAGDRFRKRGAMSKIIASTIVLFGAAWLTIEGIVSRFGPWIGKFFGMED